MTGGHEHVVDLDPGEIMPTGGPVEIVAGLAMDVSTPARRHPVELTTDRISDHVETYGRHLTPAEIDTLAEATEVLDGLRVRLDGLERRKARES
jgi:hypothetical protein